jgi:RimJ/RimL family protein N-acetyltransferase
VSGIGFDEVDLDGGAGELVDFLVAHEYPFHVRARVTPDQVRESLAAGRYSGPDHRALWVTAEGRRVGLVVLEDLEDAAEGGTPLFDLRLATAERGRGLGAELLRALTAYVFTNFPGATRFEGQTREDNIAMRKSFLRAGFLKEAHYRESWPVAGEAAKASVAYAILRRDWESGTVTTFEWEDLPA